MGTESREGHGSTPGYSPARQLPVPRILRCSREITPPGHLPAVRPFAAPCRRGVDTAGPPTRLRIGQCAGLGRRGPASSPGPLITRRRALPGPEPTHGVAVRAARREVRHGWAGWAAPRQHLASGCRGSTVPTGAATPRHGPASLPRPDPRASPHRGSHLLPAVAGQQHPKSGLIPFRFWPLDLRTGSSRLGTGKTGPRTGGN